jgi:hypothetical protein
MTAAATEPKQDVVNTIQSGGFGRRFYCVPSMLDSLEV